jgi:hypothetical protein
MMERLPLLFSTSDLFHLCVLIPSTFSDSTKPVLILNTFPINVNQTLERRPLWLSAFGPLYAFSFPE